MTPTCRVFLCTYRRAHLLKRALASLLAQTHTDWVAELHNDDPTDPEPGRMVAELGDARIRCVNHAVNLGPTRTFGLMYREPPRERYVSLLEDDNWWEPGFLEAMVEAMDRHPDVQVGWANMRKWEEQEDGSWRDTGERVWEIDEREPVLFSWPNPRQVRGALHSNGAMLVRSAEVTRLRIPDSTPFAAIEPVRERCFRFPILLHPEPLANFAITRTTSRGDARAVWGQCQALLAATYLRHVRPDSDACRKLWEESRASQPPATGALITAGLMDAQARYALRYSRPVDWLRYAKGFVRRPWDAVRVLRARTEWPEVWASLDAATRQQVTGEAET